MFYIFRYLQYFEDILEGNADPNTNTMKIIQVSLEPIPLFGIGGGEKGCTPILEIYQLNREKKLLLFSSETMSDELVSYDSRTKDSITFYTDSIVHNDIIIHFKHFTPLHSAEPMFHFGFNVGMIKGNTVISLRHEIEKAEKDTRFHNNFRTIVLMAPYTESTQYDMSSKEKKEQLEYYSKRINESERDGTICFRGSKERKQNLVDIARDIGCPTKGTYTVKGGWLWVIDRRNLTSKRRWFVLKGSTLTYHKAPRELKPIGTIIIGNIQRIRIIDSLHEYPYSFDMELSDSSTSSSTSSKLLIYAISKDNLESWVKAIVYSRDLFHLKREKSIHQSLGTLEFHIGECTVINLKKELCCSLQLEDQTFTTIISNDNQNINQKRYPNITSNSNATTNTNNNNSLPNSSTFRSFSSSPDDDSLKSHSSKVSPSLLSSSFDKQSKIKQFTLDFDDSYTFFLENIESQLIIKVYDGIGNENGGSSKLIGKCYFNMKDVVQQKTIDTWIELKNNLDIDDSDYDTDYELNHQQKQNKYDEKDDPDDENDQDNILEEFECIEKENSNSSDGGSGGNTNHHHQRDDQDDFILNDNDNQLLFNPSSASASIPIISSHEESSSSSDYHVLSSSSPIHLHVKLSYSSNRADILNSESKELLFSSDLIPSSSTETSPVITRMRMFDKDQPYSTTCPNFISLPSEYKWIPSDTLPKKKPKRTSFRRSLSVSNEGIIDDLQQFDLILSNRFESRLNEICSACFVGDTLWTGDSRGGIHIWDKTVCFFNVFLCFFFN